jgi:hypothetical protein
MIAEPLVEDHFEGVVLAQCGRESSRGVLARVGEDILAERCAGGTLRIVRERYGIDPGEVIVRVVVLGRFD